MTGDVDGRVGSLVAAVAADAELTPLWAVVHARLCAGVDPARVVTVKVTGLSRAGVSTLRSWLDTTTRRRRTGSAVTVAGQVVTVPVRELLGILELSGDDLVTIVERAAGRPVVDRSAAARWAGEAKAQLWDHARVVLADTPKLVAAWRKAGVADEQVAGTRLLIDQLAAALARLPEDPPVALAKLAHDVTGDPHRFDLTVDGHGQRLAAAVAERFGRVLPARPHLVRRMLADVGVLADRFSSTVTLLGVDAGGDGLVDSRLRDALAGPWPVPVSLYDLVVHPPRLAVEVLTVVENPSVLEAALVRGVRMALACTSGSLTSVDHELLTLAYAQGVALRYAGDLDGGGRGIATVVAEHYDATLVAMDLTDRGDGRPVVFQEDDAVLDVLLGPPR